jgi:signal transduction histidine kinase
VSASDSTIGVDPSVTRRLLISYLTITAFVLALLVVPLGVTFSSRERDQLIVDLERDATVVAALAEDALENGTGVEQLQGVAERYEDRTGARVVIVDADGIEVADSDPPSDQPRDFSTRPEFETALDGDRAEGGRYSETLDTGLILVAVPVASGGTVHGAVRVGYTTAELDARVRANWLRLGVLSAVVLALVAGVGVLLARGVTRPVRRLNTATQALAAGDLDARVPVESGPPELKALGLSFNEMADRMQLLLVAQRSFVADASHQLRTPLTALRLRLENLGAAVDSRVRADLEAAVSETARLSRLVNGLLLLARHDGVRVACQPTDAPTLIAGRIAHWAPLAEEQGVVLRFEPPDSAVVVLALPDALTQVLDNLIDNALGATPAGSSVVIECHRRADGAEIHVIDDGPGLSPEDRDRAFDRFWRGPGSEPGGSGLGLSIVRQLVEQCRGTVELRATPGGGLDATVMLPAPSA